MKLFGTITESGLYKLDKRDRSGKLLSFFVGKFEKHTDYRNSAVRLGISEDSIIRVIESMQATRHPAELELCPEVPERTAYRVRSELSPNEATVSVDDIQTAIELASSEHGKVIEWDNQYYACCLDIDFPDYYKPETERLLNFIDTIQPVPLAFWPSKSGSVHAIYTQDSIYSADELASVAAYQIYRRYPNCVPEFLHRSRVPYGDVQTRTPTANTDSIRSLLVERSGVELTEMEAWLTERELTVGQRYPHTHCPVNPSKRAMKNSPPVVVYDDHIYCYICAKDGRISGSRTAGYFPISSMVGSRINSLIANCVRNFVHYGHAKYILDSQIACAGLSRRVYSALLKVLHGDDTRIQFVFNAGEPNGLVRHMGHWCDKQGAPVSLASSSHILRTLPHCMTVKPNGANQPNPVASEWLSMPVDHTARGYAPVTPIHGIQVTQFQRHPENSVYTVLTPHNLRSEQLANRRPRYVPITHRMDEEKAWNTIGVALPKLDRRLVEAMVVARGCSELRSGLPPMLVLSGPTGVGKTGHCQVAASILGDDVATVLYSRDRDRFNNAILNGKSRCGIVFFDEFFKSAKTASTDVTTAMETLLSFTPDSMIYLIHIGAIPLGRLPVFVWADTKVPDEILTHEQIGRRTHIYELRTELEWEKSLAEVGIKEPRELRLSPDMQYVEACNSILSSIIDRWFSADEPTDFADVMRELGIKKLRNNEITGEKYEAIRRLYEAWKRAPELTDKNDIARFGKAGWKLARTGDGSPFTAVWEECAPFVDELDLQKVLKTETPIVCEYRKHGARYAIRFSVR